MLQKRKNKTTCHWLVCGSNLKLFVSAAGDSEETPISDLKQYWNRKQEIKTRFRKVGSILQFLYLGTHGSSRAEFKVLQQNKV